MAQDFYEIGVVIIKRKLSNPYIDFSFAPYALIAPTDTPLNTSLGFIEGGELFYAGAHRLLFHSGETGHYRDNLISETPSIWVALRNQYNELPQVYHVTLDPYEGEALVTNNLDDCIEKLPLPAALAGELAAFIQEHHVEQVFIKRQRNKFRTDDNRFEGKLDA